MTASYGDRMTAYGHRATASCGDRTTMYGHRVTTSYGRRMTVTADAGATFVPPHPDAPTTRHRSKEQQP
ncbi:hypothetical protein ACFVT5_33340 [Streptomyces sp. NPDC058001]|uniref:hypothetical protein n=1 Tax=Streptomyces sp. NPDC058001 TaxID=3346300 RepID=UPI0036E667F1